MSSQNSEIKICQNCKTSFPIEPEDFEFYEKIKVPPPTFCPECRLQRRMLFRNDRTFYRRKCDLCNESIIATYRIDAVHPVYCVKCWWSDKWDPSSYGVDFDFTRGFFEQYQELLNKVPALAIMNDNGVSSIDCEYTYDWFYSKNCYMNVSGWHAENVLYSFHIEHNKDLMDCMHMRESELAYESLQSYKISKCVFCTYCSDSFNCYFGFDLRGCSDCLMCIGLRNKSYCIKNVQYSKQDYIKIVEKLNLSSFETLSKLKKEFEEFSLSYPHKYAYILNSVNSTGDFIINSKNAKNCFMVINGENLKFMFGSDTGKDTYDCDMTGKPELCYNSMVADESKNTKYTVFCFKANGVDYSMYCPNSEWSFGCVGFKKASYTIFNKKYTKEEYNILREKIIAHMKQTGEYGEFFPKELSPYGYNESSAQELFPLGKTEAIKLGYTWVDENDRNYQIDLQPALLPDTIENVWDEIIDQIIGCEHSGSCNHKCTTAFKITSNELSLYQKLNLPIPHFCPNCRHYERLARRNPLKLWHRTCMNDGCSNEFETSYAPERPERVFCEECYNKEIY